MLTAIVLAGICTVPPLMDMSGPTCTKVYESVECRCSEAMTWDVSPTAEWYEVNRINPDNTTMWVGDTRWRDKVGYTDEDGNVFPPVIAQALWYFVWDISIPQEGQTYQYRVRACLTQPQGATSCGGVPTAPGQPCCGTWNDAADTSTRVTYTAAPYRVYAHP